MNIHSTQFKLDNLHGISILLHFALSHYIWVYLLKSGFIPLNLGLSP